MAETMQKLDTWGQNISSNPKKSSPKYGGGQIINVTYGHTGSGKLYSYYGTNKRAGDIVTPEVTHPKSGKTYRTLAVVRSTQNIGNGASTVDYLQQRQSGSRGQNIDRPRAVKWIGKTDQTSLPGYAKYKDHGGAKEWKREAQAAYDLKLEIRLDDSIPKMQKLNLYRMIDDMRRK